MADLGTDPELIIKKAELQIKKIETFEDIDKISLDWNATSFDETMIIGNIQGRVDVLEVPRVIEYEETADVFKMKFDEAISALTAKKPELFADIENITDEMKQNFFWIKKSTDLEMTKRVYKNLTEAINKGSTFREWLKSIDADIIAPKSYYENVFRTNMSSVYGAGRYVQQQKSVTQEYFLYDAVVDGRETELCNSLNDKV